MSLHALNIHIYAWMTTYFLKFIISFVPTNFKLDFEEYISNTFYNVFKVDTNYVISSFRTLEQVQNDLDNNFNGFPVNATNAPISLKIRGISFIGKHNIEEPLDYEKEMNRILDKWGREEVTGEELNFLNFLGTVL